MPLDPVDAPGAFARLHSQAALLGVNREHRELGLREGTWKQTADKSGCFRVFLIICWILRNVYIISTTNAVFVLLRIEYTLCFFLRLKYPRMRKEYWRKKNGRKITFVFSLSHSHSYPLKLINPTETKLHPILPNFPIWNWCRSSSPDPNYLDRGWLVILSLSIRDSEWRRVKWRNNFSPPSSCHPPFRKS